jgi:hypothetical protein
MKTIVLLLTFGLTIAPAGRATEQANDTLTLGGNTYGIFQLPMSGYWHLEGEDPRGRQPLPPFEFTSPANWRGYVAEWAISHDKLQLIGIEGQIEGNQLRNRQILDKQFPVYARWFTGKIYIGWVTLTNRNRPSNT